MAWEYTGAVRRTYSRGSDFAWMSNEDLGWIASLVDSTNHAEEFSQAYVASIDLFEETQIFEAIQTIHNSRINTIGTLSNGDVVEGLLIYYSMLDKAAAATFSGTATDAEDEMLKAQLDGPFFVGQNHWMKEVATDLSPVSHRLDIMLHNHWTPHQNLRARTPIFTKFVGNAGAVAIATGIMSAASHALFEEVAQRQIWRPSRLRRSERFAVADVIKFQLIDT